MKLNSTALLVAGMLLSLASHVQATPFDVTSVSVPGGSGNAFWTEAEGSSNGIGWSISGFLSWMSATTIDESYQGFTGGNFAPALPNSDRLHTFGTTMTITFDQNISSILFYLKENGGTSTLDFGLTPTLVSGTATISGTKVTGTVAGGVVRFSGLNTATLTSTTTILDGMDAAWVATAVPDGGTSVLLLGVGLAGLGWVRRKLAE